MSVFLTERYPYVTNGLRDARASMQEKGEYPHREMLSAGFVPKCDSEARSVELQSLTRHSKAYAGLMLRCFRPPVDKERHVSQTCVNLGMSPCKSCHLAQESSEPCLLFHGLSKPGEILVAGNFDSPQPSRVRRELLNIHQCEVCLAQMLDEMNEGNL